MAALLLPLSVVAACSSGPTGGSGEPVTVVVGYQSKTINTVTAGTLLRSLGSFEQRLKALGERTGKTYDVRWEDYPAGAPITAQMLARKIDIGSMGDYPLLINGSRAQAGGERTVMLSVTGYNPLGALNMVVTRPDSPAVGLADLRGKPISTSVGSAAHGTLVQALKAAGLDPKADVSVQNQDPAVGASALTSGSVAALSQFVAWPGLLVFQNQAKLVYDGSALGVPTLHGTVARSAFVDQHPEVSDEFLRAQLDATNYIHESTPLTPHGGSPTPRGCRPRWSTSTTARAGWPPSTPPSSRRSGTCSRPTPHSSAPSATSRRSIWTASSTTARCAGCTATPTTTTSP
jgi:NitT/TauT family transport system substrate-binding protein